MHIRKILATTDLSPESERGIVEAVELAKRLGAEVTLVTAVDVESHLPLGALALPADKARTIENEVREKVADALDALEAKHFGAGERARAEVVLGKNPARTIADYAERGGYDLIVIATHGATGVRHLLLGSVAEKVLRFAHCPVLVVRSEEPGKEAATRA